MIVFVKNLNKNGGEFSLSTEQAQHCKAQRLRNGETVTLSDQSYLATGQIFEKNRQMICYYQSAELISNPSRPAVHVYFPLCKPDRMSWMIEKLTEIGVQSLTPLISEFSQTHYWSNHSHERMLKIIESACIQSKQYIQPFLNPPVNLRNLSLASVHENELYIVGDLLDSPSELSDSFSHLTSTQYHLLIGPEGGWSTKDRECFPQNSLKICLDMPTLRAETAAIVLSSLLILNKMRHKINQ